MTPNTLARPLALLGSSWAFYKKNWKPLTAIVVLPYAAIFISTSLIRMAVYASMPSILPLAVAGLLLGLAGAIFMVAAGNGLIHAIDRLTQDAGHQVSISAQYAVGFSLFWPFVLLMIIRTLASFGASVLLIIPAIIVGIYTAVAFYSLVVDGKRGFAALTESYALVRGRWWKTLWRILLIVLVYIVVSLILSGLQFLLAYAFGYGMDSAPYVLLNTLVGVVVFMVGTPLAVIYGYQLFASLKATRIEGAPEAAFKKWLVAFIAIGLLFLIGVFFLGSLHTHGVLVR